MRVAIRSLASAVVLLLAALPVTGVAQTASVTMQVAVIGSNFDVSLYVARTGGTAFNLGDATFAFNFNSAALTYSGEQAEGIWDNGTSADYEDQFSAPYGGSVRSIETSPVFQATGTDVPTSATLIGTLRFTITDPSANHNVTWDQGNSAVLTAGLEEVTVTYNNPSNGTLPVQLSSFTAMPVQEAGQVLVKWTTISETNNYGFEVQKSATADGEFLTIENSFVQGHGTTIEKHNYSFTDANAQGEGWYYRLKQIDLDGGVQYSDAIKPSGVTDVKEKEIPKEFALDQNYPNPFNPSTVINFALPRESMVSLEVYNLIGQRVAVLVNEVKPAGYHSLRFNGASFSSGIYFYSLVTGDTKFLRKMVLVK